MMASKNSSASAAAATSSSSGGSSSRPAESGKPETGEIYEFKITLEYSKPPIWRRIQVDGDISFARFHLIINRCMGWHNCHLYKFFHKDMTIGKQEFNFGFEESADSTKTTIKQIFMDQGIKTLKYEYDFGDGWSHKVTLEKMVPRVHGRRYPHCIAGRKSCPPEDCGGIGGYYELLRKLSDPTDEEHDDLKTWMEEGGRENFDPDRFDLAEVNAELASY